MAPAPPTWCRSAGGWLFDQVLAGWDVTVVTSDQADQRALRILGVRDRELELALAMPGSRAVPGGDRGPGRDVPADERVRRMVRGSRGGPDRDPALGRRDEARRLRARADPVAHRLSAAARAFKAQAMAAAAAGAGPADTEVFRRAARRRPALV